MSEVDVDAVATAAASCPSVVALSGGVLGEVATYLPRRRVIGVRIGAGWVEVHVVAHWVASLPEVGEEVRAAVGPHVGSRQVMVHIDDIAVEVD